MPPFREAYAAARLEAHRGLYAELAAVIATRPRREAYAARKRIMARTPKRYGVWPKAERPDLLGELNRKHAHGARLLKTLVRVFAHDDAC